MLKKIGVVCIMAAALSLLSLGINYWVYLELQKRLEIRFEGQYIPSLFIPSFELKQARFSWEDKVQLVDGNFKVTFDPLTLISQNGLRVIVTSHDSKVKLLGSWAVQQGVEAATVDSLVADILLGRHGLAGINEVEAVSKSFQFSLKSADKISAKNPEVS